MKPRLLLPTLFLALASCATNVPAQGKLVLCSIFPEYEWTKAVVGDVAGIDLRLLQDSGADLHSFQPTVSDMITLSKSDLFIYNGGESDDWVDDALEIAEKEDRLTLNLMEAVEDRLRPEEHQEGMEGESEDAYDEHIWLSLENARVCVDAIAQKLSLLLPEQSAVFAENAATYASQLQNLSARYEEAAKKPGNKEALLFADRFPFLYMAKDYGLDYYAAFSGCSAESEASVKTIIFLAKKADELGLDTILILDGSEGATARTVRDATQTKDQKILTMDSLQSTRLSDNKTYVQAMEANLNTLKEALA